MLTDFHRQEESERLGCLTTIQTSDSEHQGRHIHPAQTSKNQGTKYSSLFYLGQELELEKLPEPGLGSSCFSDLGYTCLWSEFLFGDLGHRMGRVSLRWLLWKKQIWQRPQYLPPQNQGLLLGLHGGGQSRSTGVSLGAALSLVFIQTILGSSLAPFWNFGPENTITGFTEAL